ncbi:hypothetical protein JQ491_03920 [Helicobacter pylori]|uniref:hypothetical protein n=1 Tax=Helicobacter pylori TaxID=210 RepID=UPI00193A2E8D|nr:hypothetical protein [Helicobacter pylori]MBM2624642.1 hypothetical protein [Helicobacter pylori]
MNQANNLLKKLSLGVKGYKRERILPHLKECEFMYKKNLHQVLLKWIRKKYA